MPPTSKVGLYAAIRRDAARLCAAIVDHGGNIIETGTDSYRLAHVRAQADDRDQQRQSRPAKR
jgi:hypothetical protein